MLNYQRVNCVLFTEATVIVFNLMFFVGLGPRSRAKFRRDSGEVGLKHIAAKTSLKDVEGISTTARVPLQRTHYCCCDPASTTNDIEAIPGIKRIRLTSGISLAWTS